MRRHRLRREIIATRVANQLVDRAGTTFMFRLREDTGASHADIARASVIARDVFDMRTLWAEVEALDGAVTADTQTWMLLSGRRMVERAARWLLRTRPRPMDIGAEVARFADGARAVAELLPGVLVESERQAWQDRVAGLTDAGVPEALAARVASQGALFSALDIVEVAGATERGVEEVAGLHFELGGELHLHWLRDQIALLTRDTRWADDGPRRAARRPVLPARGPHARGAALRVARRLVRGQPAPRSSARRTSWARSGRAGPSI